MLLPLKVARVLFWVATAWKHMRIASHQTRLSWTKCALLIYLIIYKHAIFMVENPLTSLARILIPLLWLIVHVCKLWDTRYKIISHCTELDCHPRLAALFAALPVEQSFTWLGEFGSPTPKPVKLWSNCTFIHGLRRTHWIPNHPCRASQESSEFPSPGL